jgi:hypothetical protein
MVSLLYYYQAVSPTIITTITTLASQQATATEDTDTKLLQLLNYCATHTDSKIRFIASDILLNIHSDVRNLNKLEVRSRAGGNFFIISNPNNGYQHHNGAFLT